MDVNDRLVMEKLKNNIKELVDEKSLSSEKGNNRFIDGMNRVNYYRATHPPETPLTETEVGAIQLVGDQIQAHSDGCPVEQTVEKEMRATLNLLLDPTLRKHFINEYYEPLVESSKDGHTTYSV